MTPKLSDHSKLNSTELETHVESKSFPLKVQHSQQNLLDYRTILDCEHPHQWYLDGIRMVSLPTFVEQ